MKDTLSKTNPALLANWLLVVALMVFIIVIVGGITRLTESGLSITEWKPVMGTLPPLSDADWAAEFEKYKQIPEYIEINGPAGMDLEAFKFIYFWEWFHRLWGRLIGLAIALPLARFWLRGRIPAGYKPRLLALLALVGLQGAIGWWMVASGLETRTDVSHYRLAAHLLTALFILGGLVWTALDLRQLAKNGRTQPARLTGFSVAILTILFIQLLFGAWVAGLNAGYVSNTWPLMNGRFFPEGIEWRHGALFAIINDPFLTHFIHRWWAWITVIALVIMARKLRREARIISVVIHTTFGIQILLGIATVMKNMNINLAVLHQAVGALVVAAAVWGAHHLGLERRSAE